MSGWPHSLLGEQERCTCQWKKVRGKKKKKKKHQHVGNYPSELRCDGERSPDDRPATRLRLAHGSAPCDYWRVAVLRCSGLGDWGGHAQVTCFHSCMLHDLVVLLTLNSAAAVQKSSTRQGSKKLPVCDVRPGKCRGQMLNCLFVRDEHRGPRGRSMLH